MSQELQKLSLFYDGACPLCQAEITFLSRRNNAGLLDFVDINSQFYDPHTTGVSCDQALASMYGQYANGELINGVSVFSEAYRRADLPFLVWVFSQKALQPLLQISYSFFARNRHTISKIFGPGALWLVNRTNNRK